MNKSILILKGSPREKGNSAILADQVFAGAKYAGAAVESVFLHGMNIQPCDACDVCQDGYILLTVCQVVPGLALGQLAQILPKQDPDLLQERGTQGDRNGRRSTTLHHSRPLPGTGRMD